MTRVCIADPASVFRAAVRHVLGKEKDFEVVEARSLRELEAALERDVDIVLVDGDLPPDGAAAAIELAAGRCDHVVAWSLHPRAGDVLTAIRAGASGYLRKDISPRGLVRSLRALTQGESALSRDLATLLVGALRADDARARIERRAEALSPREVDVLRHIASGARNRDIASALSISEFTVKRHVQNILEKLDVPSRHEAAALLEAGAGGDRSAVPGR